MSTVARCLVSAVVAVKSLTVTRNGSKSIFIMASALDWQKWKRKESWKSSRETASLTCLRVNTKNTSLHDLFHFFFLVVFVVLYFFFLPPF